MTLDRAAFTVWLDRYIAAWRSNDPAQVGDLFSVDALYRHRPTDEPLRGRAAIVRDWTEEPDDPATWQATYAPLAIDGDVHVASGESRYFASDGNPEVIYANVFICRFDDDGRCSDFTEYWTLDRHFDA